MAYRVKNNITGVWLNKSDAEIAKYANNTNFTVENIEDGLRQEAQKEEDVPQALQVKRKGRPKKA